ncbi:putative E3 ubiquitin-protein ligase RHB1A [Frankliniella fusca]|uniref:E3 ubiquitin-protein ligase RHB1A n=1 Tax=Frankliniella fusca TaxID=407009 RepID=A0AAE1HMJ9_9NEOP|nr:putative E3 ubiquitin-protein ligase RHB1A [Frankliniella fusca]
MDSASSSSANNFQFARLQSLRECLNPVKIEDEEVLEEAYQTVDDVFALSALSESRALTSASLTTSPSKWAYGRPSASSTLTSVAAVECSPHQRSMAVSQGDGGSPSSPILTPAAPPCVAASACPPPARDGGNDAAPAAAAVIMLAGNQAQDLWRSVSSLFPAELPLTWRLLPAATSSASETAVQPASTNSSIGPISSAVTSRRSVPGKSQVANKSARSVPSFSRLSIPEISSGLRQGALRGIDIVSVSSSEDEEDTRQNVASDKMKRVCRNSFRGSLPSTSSQGFDEENITRVEQLTKRKPGRPKGSKNKPKRHQAWNAGQNNSLLFTECNVCFEKSDGRRIMTDCGHRFHQDCLANWNSRNFPNRCPVCDTAYNKTIPFYG